MLNNPEEQKIVKDCLNEMVDSMIRIAAERDLIKEIVARIKEETTVKPKVFRRMAKTQYQSNFSEVVAEDEEFVELYERLNEALNNA
jgi:uncharacterized protein YukE